MSILEVSKEIIKNINTLKEKRKSMNKENEKSNLNITLESKKSKYKKNIKLRITYLTTVIQFLDLNSLISLSLVNKEFYYFLSSIYVYKFIIKIQRHQKIMKYNNKKDIKSIKSDNINKTTNLNKKGGYSFFSALTGALSYFTPSTELNNIKTEKKPDLNEINNKIDLHLNILKDKIKQLNLSKQIIENRKNIDELINERFSLKEQIKFNNRNTIIQEKEYEKIKREKYENEYKNTLNELNTLKNNFSKLKKEYELNKKEYIENESNLNKIGEYINKNLN
jgi:hypothetical protein